MLPKDTLSSQIKCSLSYVIKLYPWILLPCNGSALPTEHYINIDEFLTQFLRVPSVVPYNDLNQRISIYYFVLCI